MASISFRTPEKSNDENKPLPRTPRTPSSHKLQDLGRTSSQKKARQIFDSLRSLKSRGKASSDAEDESAQSAGAGSPIRRKNSTWDLFGTIRSKKSGEFGVHEKERPLTTTPLRPGLEIGDAPELLPRRRKSLVNMLGSISTKVSSRRNTNLREVPLNGERLPDYCEEDIFAERLAKELAHLKVDSPIPAHTSTSIRQSRFPNERLGGANALGADHNGIIENFKIRQLDDLLNDRDGYDAKSWTSKAQTLQNEESDEQVASQTPTTDEDGSKTPDSYLRSMIKSFDDYNSEPTVLKSKGANVSASPSPDKLAPTKPVDFLKDLSPDVIPSNQSIETTSSLVFHTDKPERFERIYREEKQPMITIREVTSESDSSLVYEDPIAPSPPTWQDAAKSRTATLESRGRLPDRNYARYIQEFDPLFISQTAERRDYCRGLEVIPSNIEDSDQQRIARSIKQTVDKMTKNLYLSSFSEETTEERDEELQEESYPSELEYKYSLGSDDLWKTVESISANSLGETSAVTVIRNNISSFKNIEFWEGPMYVRYPQSGAKWRHVVYFPTGSLALLDIRKQNKGEYSDTITYCPEESCIYVHLWGKLPEPESDLSVRVRYPETETRWARTQIYDSGDLAMADMNQQNLGEFSEIRYDASERVFHVYTWGDVIEASHGSVHVDYPEANTRSARTQIFRNKDLAMADMCLQSRGEFAEVRYDASKRRYRAFAWGDVIDTPDSYVRVDFPEPEIERDVRVDYPEANTRWARTQMYENDELAKADMRLQSRGEFSEVRYNASKHCFRAFAWGDIIDSSDDYIHIDFLEPEIERNVRVDYPETKTRWARTQMYETEDLAKADISRLNNGEYSNFVYSSPERRFRVEAQPKVLGSIYRTRERVWKPTLSPLGDRDENEQDLPDFSDLEKDFQLVATEWLRSSSPGIQSQEGAEELLGDDSAGSNDMSLCVEAGTPRKSNEELVAELYMGNHSDQTTPLLRGSKQILQYLDSLNGKHPTSKILHAKNDFQLNRRTATKAWAESEDDDRESRSIEKAAQGARDMTNDHFAQISRSILLDDYSDDGTTSLGIEIVEENSRENSDQSFTQGFEYSQFADTFDEGKNYGISIQMDEVSEDEEGMASNPANANENFIFDFGRDMAHRRERSNAISGEVPPVILSSDKSNENIYIVPIDNNDLYEENAGCGDPELPPSSDTDLTGDALTNYKIDTHLYSMNLTKSEFEGKEEQSVYRPGLWAGTCAKVQDTRNASACTASSVYSQPGLEFSSMSATNTEKAQSSEIQGERQKDSFTGNNPNIEDGAFRVETVSQEYIDYEIHPLATTRASPQRAAIKANTFHTRNMMFPASTNPFLNRPSSPHSPFQPIASSKRAQPHTQGPRIVTPSGKVYSPAKEEHKVSNPIQRIQTPGHSRSEQRSGNLSRDLNRDLSGDETEFSEDFGEELEPMGKGRYAVRSARGDGSVSSVSVDEAF
ncbi:hypothetical protein SBOR_6634 [Sclerotinia borealis F-4128]|uniref:Uncharacterized protein n=1 Tax=Sclerotinia borealis (strain F-4128) TaxID=1432307 RepID=W9CAY2_SCLBF|nr:hypothetical protein SBOR_6634 [Sclerotinia borealis F-4128]